MSRLPSGEELAQVPVSAATQGFGIALEDQAFDLATLRHMANGIEAAITEVPGSSHVGFVTHPETVAETIQRAAVSVAAAAN